MRLQRRLLGASLLLYRPAGGGLLMLFLTEWSVGEGGGEWGAGITVATPSSSCTWRVWRGAGHHHQGYRVVKGNAYHCRSDIPSFIPPHRFLPFTPQI